MHPTPPALSSRDSALWRVGRNLHRFQLIEALLKSLMPSTKLAGMTPQELESQMVAKQRAAKKASLGTLTEAYSLQVLSPQQEAEKLEVESEALFSIRHSIDASPDVLKQMRSDWRRLTKERNQLVHTILLDYDLRSQERCLALCEYLDEQYERAQILIEGLKYQQNARSLLASAFIQMMDSAELEKPLEDLANGSYTSLKQDPHHAQ
jgi:hypothetical protein